MGAHAAKQRILCGAEGVSAFKRPLRQRRCGLTIFVNSRNIDSPALEAGSVCSLAMMAEFLFPDLDGGPRAAFVVELDIYGLCFRKTKLSRED